MAAIGKKNFNSPDETAYPGEKLKAEVVTLGGVAFQKITAEQGWKWSEHTKPVVKTDNCQKHHLIYVISGTLASSMQDGTEMEFASGELGEIPPGHDGWTVGDESVVWLEIPH
jgi:hypothetical protein